MNDVSNSWLINFFSNFSNAHDVNRSMAIRIFFYWIYNNKISNKKLRHLVVKSWKWIQWNWIHTCVLCVRNTWLHVCMWFVYFHLNFVFSLSLITHFILIIIIIRSWYTSWQTTRQIIRQIIQWIVPFKIMFIIHRARKKIVHHHHHHHFRLLNVINVRYKLLKIIYPNMKKWMNVLVLILFNHFFNYPTIQRTDLMNQFWKIDWIYLSIHSWLVTIFYTHHRLVNLFIQL